MKCQITKCNNQVIYSGVDSFMLNVPVETVCYECANTYNELCVIKENYYARFNAKEGISNA